MLWRSPAGAGHPPLSAMFSQYLPLRWRSREEVNSTSHEIGLSARAAGDAFQPSCRRSSLHRNNHRSARNGALLHTLAALAETPPR